MDLMGQSSPKNMGWGYGGCPGRGFRGAKAPEKIWVFVPRFRESGGTLNLIRPSVPLSVCLSVRLSQKL